MSQLVATAPTAAWNYDLTEALPGHKCLLLTSGGIAILGVLPADGSGFMAWSPLPKRDRAREAELIGGTGGGKVE